LRVLGVDFGSKKIGIAVGGDDPMIVSAQPNIQPSGTLKIDAEALSELARKWEAEAIVLGIPVNEVDPKMQRICGMLAERIRETGMEVFEVDESGSSNEADAVWRDEGEKVAMRKRLRDGEAARIIVERFFAQRQK
jgi:putative transcription antitermination factor YqgF